jgi:predicted DNA binding CopG/RHH family protein
MSKRAPRLRTDDEAEAFLEQDLSEYIDPAHMVPLRYEVRPKGRSVNLRLSEELLGAVKARAKEEGIPYQRFIRLALEQALARGSEDARAR